MKTAENTNETATLNNVRTVREVTLTYGRTFQAVSAACTSPAPAVDLFRSMVGSNATREHFCAAYLDSKNRVIGAGIISIGTLNASLVHPREVFAPAVHMLAAAVIVGHNHPSGDVTPSKDDDTITQRLASAGEVLGIRVLDHVVFDTATDRGVRFYSYATSSPQTLNQVPNDPGVSPRGVREDGPAYRPRRITPGNVDWKQLETALRDTLVHFRAQVICNIREETAKGIPFARAIRNMTAEHGTATLMTISDLIGEATGRGFPLDGFLDEIERAKPSADGTSTAREDGPAYGAAKSAKRRALEAGKVLGATVRYGGRAGGTRRLLEITAEAPEGSHFAGSGLHEMVSCWGIGETADDVWRDMAERLESETVEKCGPDCEWWGDPATDGTSTAREDGPAYGASPRCECSDPACPVHAGGSCRAEASQVLARVDMGGAPVRMCDACAEDAHGSGLFANVPDTTAGDPAPVATIEDAQRLLNATRNVKNFAYHGDLDLGQTWAFAGIGDTHRDADTVTRSNHRVIYRDLLARFPDDVAIVHASHFACGWYDHLTVRVLETEDATEPRPIVSAVVEWAEALADYPAASDDDLAEIEWDEIMEAVASTQGTEAVEEFLKERDGFDGHAERVGEDSFRSIYGERVDKVLRERAEHNGTDVTFNLNPGDLDFLPPVTDPDYVDTMRAEGDEDGANEAEEGMRAWARRATLAGIEAIKVPGLTFAQAAAAYAIPAWYFGPYREAAAALKSFEATPDLFLLTIDHPPGGYAADPAGIVREDGPDYGVATTCPGCGGPNDFWGRVDGGPCMECVKARARATTGGGRCKCGRKARPRDVRTSGRCWVACDRCLGTIRRLPDASMVREDGSEYGAPDDLRNEDDPALWNPRYVLFARFNGRTPADQRRRDREKNGAAVNLGFMVWISGMLVRCGREHPSAMLNGYAYDHATWDAFLLRETEQREALRTKVAEGPNDHAIPLVDLRPGDCVRILGQILPVDSDFAARWKLRGETTIPAYAVILAGAHIAGPDPEDEDARSAVPPAPGDGASTVREDGPEYGVRRPWRIGDRVQYWQPGFPSGTVVGGSREDDRVLVRWDDEPDDMWVDPRDVTDGEPVRNDPPANDPPAGFWGKLSAKEDALRRAVRSLRDARDALRSVHADRAAAAVCRAMKSAEGALRHAQGIASRAARKQGGPS